MSHTTLTADDSRLTAYVLGELDAADVAAVEAALAASPELQRVVDELRATSADLFAALQAEPVPALKPLASPLRKGLRADVPTIRHSRQWQRQWTANLVTLGLLAGAGVGLTSWSNSGGNRRSTEDTVAQLGVTVDGSRGESLAREAESRLLLEHRDQPWIESQRSRERGGEGRWSRSDGSVPAGGAVDSDFGTVAATSRPTTGPASGAAASTDADHDAYELATSEGRPEVRARMQFTDGLDRGLDSESDEALVESAPVELNLQEQLITGPDGGGGAFRPAAAQLHLWSAASANVASKVRVLSIHGGQPQDSTQAFQYFSESSGDANAAGALPLQNPVGANGAVDGGVASAEAAGSFYAGHRFMLIDDFGALGRPVTEEKLAEPEDLQRLDRVSESESLGEVYAPIIENPFIVPAGEAALSTFALDVDTASYSNVRRFLTQQQLPPPDAVRIEELVNYFSYSLPQPQGDAPFSVTLEATSCPWNPQHKLVRVGLKGRELDLSQRPQTRLVFLLDVSGSMSDANKLPFVQESMKLLVEQLGENDRIAIVTYSDTAELKLDSTIGSNRAAILAAIDSLVADGSTNGAGGIQLAYEVASRQFLADGANRVILCTDGDFNVGVSDDDALVKMIEEKRDTGVFLSIFGYGMGNLKDAKLEGLADKGNGHYGYIDDLDEARKVFLEELTGTLYTIAKDVKLQVEFNPAKVGAYRLLGYENRLLAAADFNNDSIDAGEIGAGHTVTALYEIAPPGTVPHVTREVRPAVDALRYQPAATAQSAVSDPSAAVSSTPGTVPAASPESSTSAPEAPFSTLPELLTVKLRYKQPTGDASAKLEYSLSDEPQACSRDLQFAAAVTGFGLLLRNSQFAAGCNWDLVIELAEGAKDDDVDGRRAEFIDLARQARRLWNEQHPQGRQYGRPQQMTSTPAVAPTVKPGEAAVATLSPGVVTEVTGDRFAVISLGANDGVQDGQLLDAIRISPTGGGGGTARVQVICELRIIDVQPDDSVCQRVSPPAGLTLEVGDTVVPR